MTYIKVVHKDVLFTWYDNDDYWPNRVVKWYHSEDDSEHTYSKHTFLLNGFVVEVDVFTALDLISQYIKEHEDNATLSEG